jgi:hypothetical protein
VNLELGGKILALLKSGPKTPEELRRSILGEVPESQYRTKYQAFWRALDDLVEEGVVEDAKYRYAGEGADPKFIRASMQRFEKTSHPARQRLLMEDIEAESQKRDAICTGGLLIFLAARLTDKPEDVRKLAITCLRNVSRSITESRRDADFLRAMRKQCGRKLPGVVTQDPSIEVRKEALKLLVDLGEKQTISIVEDILKGSTTEAFKEFRPILKQFLVQSYPTNRLLRAHKDALREMLQNLALSDDQRLSKRATVVLWSLRHGQADMPEGEADIQ